MRHPTRLALCALCLAVLTVALAACSPAATPTPTPVPPTPTPTPTAAPTPTPTPAAAEAPTPSPAGTQASTPEPTVASQTGASEPATVRFVVDEGTETRYLVREQLAGISFPSDAVGKTQAVKGSIVLSANNAVLAEQSSFIVDLSTLKSDQDRRDNYIKQNTLNTSRYPDAVFVPREVIGLEYPLPTSGQATFTLAGDMTIHGTTAPLTWDVTATFSEGRAEGQATTSFNFATFGMTRPRVQIVLSVEDNIRLQLDFKLKAEG